jgi:hypothetical protein
MQTRLCFTLIRLKVVITRQLLVGVSHVDSQKIYSTVQALIISHRQRADKSTDRHDLQTRCPFLLFKEVRATQSYVKALLITA